MPIEEQFKQKAMEWLIEAEELAKRGGDFVAEQAPETVRQYVTFYLWESSILTVLCAVASAGSAYTLYRLSPRIGRSWDQAIEPHIGVGVPILLAPLMVLGTVGFFVNGHVALKIWLAPNVFILEELSRLVK